jgi:hypothetical protein
MLRVLLGILALSSMACVKASGRLESNRFQHDRYPYALFYADGGSAREPLGTAFRIDNLTTDARGVTRPKHGAEYEIERLFDLDNDGKPELARTEELYDLRLESTTKDATLWLRSVPLAVADRDKDLAVLAQRYLDVAASLGRVVVPFGTEKPSAAGHRVASRVLSQSACTVSRRPAQRVDFELANVDERQAQGARWKRVSIVFVKTGYDETISIDRPQYRPVAYPVLLMIGLVTRPEDFSTFEPTLDLVLSRTVLGDVGQGLSMNGETTCHAVAAAPTSGGETAVPNTSEPVPDGGGGNPPAVGEETPWLHPTPPEMLPES